MGSVFDILWQSKSIRSERTRQLLEIFEETHSLSDWPVARHEWMKVLLWSMIIEQARKEPSLSELLEAFAKRILSNNRPEPDVYSELSAAALLKRQGWGVKKIQRTHERTADFEVFRDHRSFLLEVTQPNQKQEHEELIEYSKLLANRLAPLTEEFDYDIIVMVAAVLDGQEEADLTRSIEQLSIGEINEEAGAWKVVAEPSCNIPNTIKTREFDDLPNWWPAKHESEPVHVYGPAVVGGRKTLVACATRIKGYLNCLKRKACRFQGASEMPFVIGVSTENLPGAITEYTTELPALFTRWRHVSGVLLFEKWLQPNQIGWKLRFYSNPNATIACPLDLQEVPLLFVENCLRTNK